MFKKRKKMIFLLLLVMGVITISLTYSKYIYNNVWNYYLKSKEFYFSSNSLSYDSKKNTNLNWDGSAISFNLKNYINSESITDYDIRYKVTCSVEGDAKEYAKCVLNDSDSSTHSGVLTSNKKCINTTGDGVNVSSYNRADCNINGYTWKVETTDKDLSFNVILTDNTKSLEDVSVKLEAESTSPYKQKLTGYFELHKSLESEEKVLYEYNNYTNYDELIISNPLDTKKCLLVKWDSDIFRIDSKTDEFISYGTDNNYINEIKIAIDKNKSKSLKFYKLDLENNYSLNDFTINEINCE